MTTNRAYLILPKLIEQPTWGGYYIMKAKGWEHHPDATRKFGQSYELYSGSYLSLAIDTREKLFQPEIDSIPHNAFQIEQIRSEYADGLLGTRGMRKYAGELKTLIKFTQAKGNSFQLHVKEPDGPWLPKPESWYFIENGLATVGIKNARKISEYKKICSDIESYMQSLSQKVLTGALSLDEARDLSKAYCTKKNVYRFVNTVPVPKRRVVDLHHGGIHHSWEEDTKIIPRGNIVYEVQVDVTDDVSTLRSFDKGKIQDDGTVRPLQIDDYFRHLDASKKRNDPDVLITEPHEVLHEETITISTIFDTDYYHVDELSFSGKIPEEYTNTQHETFHHIFVLEGSLRYHDSSIDLQVGAGHSFIVPAAVGRYSIQTEHKRTIVLKTYL
ncbi:hypothetical protein HY469_01180 [Candidatus Roizmanbacteria bacterium]|nr:hypothetical protein [Candidatus Roizmanbacteria bacterium]